MIGRGVHTPVFKLLVNFLIEKPPHAHAHILWCALFRAESGVPVPLSSLFVNRLIGAKVTLNNSNLPVQQVLVTPLMQQLQ